jgi:hypothetical protein
LFTIFVIYIIVLYKGALELYPLVFVKPFLL